MGLKLIFVATLCYLACTCVANHMQMKLIKDFIKIDNKPTTVTALLNWNKRSMLQFSKEMIQNGISSTMLTPDCNLPVYKKMEYQLFIIDMTAPRLENTVLQANNSRLFGFAYRWFLLNSNSSNLDIVKPYDILTDSRVYVTKGIGDDSFKIIAIYKRTQNSTEFVENDIGLWNIDKGFQYFNQLIIPRNRSNLMQEKLPSSYVITDLNSLNHLWDLQNKHVDAVTKITYVLVHYIMDMMNASVTFRLQRSWGSKKENQTLYDGMVGDLQRGLAEIAGSVLYFTSDRITSIEYIAVTTRTKAFFILREPPLSLVGNIYLLTFENRIWYSILLMVILVSLVTYTTLYWEWKESSSTTSKTLEAPPKPRIIDIVLSQIKMICQQGTDIIPSSISGRIVLIFSLINLIFLYTSFSASIVALLQSTSDSINTLEDLLYSRIKLGVQDIPYNKYYFSIQQDPIRKAIYEKKVIPKGQLPNFMVPEVGIERMRTEFFSFYCEQIGAYTVIQKTFNEQEKCGLKTIIYIDFLYPWNTVKKNSTYKEMFKVGFRKMSETGVESRVTRQYFAEKPKCETKGGNFVSVGIVDCYFPFLVYGIGFALSVAFLILENIYHAYKSKNKKVLTTKSFKGNRKDSIPK